MLHTKFHGNRPTGSREEDFCRVFTIYGRGGHLGHVTQMPLTNFRSPYPRRLHIKFCFDWPSGFREEDVLNCGRRTTTTDDGRTPDNGYTISSPWAFGSGELILHNRTIISSELLMLKIYEKNAGLIDQDASCSPTNSIKQKVSWNMFHETCFIG